MNQEYFSDAQLAQHVGVGQSTIWRFGLLPFQTEAVRQQGKQRKGAK